MRGFSGRGAIRGDRDPLPFPQKEHLSWSLSKCSDAACTMFMYPRLVELRYSGLGSNGRWHVEELWFVFV